MYEQREIVIIPFPYSDLTATKQRPALIISNEKLNLSEDRICCLITSNTPQEGILLNQSIEDGNLPFKSWVKPHRLFTVSENVIRKKVGTISSALHQKIIHELGTYIGETK